MSDEKRQSAIEALLGASPDIADRLHRKGYLQELIEAREGPSLETKTAAEARNKAVRELGIGVPAPLSATMTRAPTVQEILLDDIREQLIDIKDQLAQQRINTVTDNRTPPALNEDRARWAEAKIQKSKSVDKEHAR